eukprot:5196793-Pyramimonas_sp.AAC.1
MLRAHREEVLHLLICQMRPAREFSLFPICFFRARGAREHSRLIAFFLARAAHDSAMVRARREEVLRVRISQMRPVREFSLFSICFFRARGA